MAVQVNLIHGEYDRESDGARELGAVYDLGVPGGLADIEAAMGQVGIPALGTVHPSAADCTLVARDARAIDGENFRVTLAWRKEKDESAAGTPFVRSGIQRFTSNRDAAGNLVFTSYEFQNTDEPWHLRGNIVTQYAELELKYPAPLLGYTRTTTDFATAFNNTLNAGQKVNSALWKGHPANTALCVNAVLEPLYGGLKWRERYEFALSVISGDTFNGWYEKYVFKKPDDAMVVDPTVGTGDDPEKWFMPYQSYDFNLLNL